MGVGFFYERGTPVHPEPLNAHRQITELFDEAFWESGQYRETILSASALVGMHPDQGLFPFFISLPVFFFFFLPLYLSLFLYLSLSCSLSVSVSASLSLYLALCIALSLVIPPFPSPPPSLPPSLHLSLYI